MTLKVLGMPYEDMLHYKRVLQKLGLHTRAESLRREWWFLNGDLRRK